MEVGERTSQEVVPMSRLNVTIAVLPVLLIGLSGQANAYNDCESDTDCIDGFVCEVMEVGVCEVAACPDGMECPEPYCYTENVGACVPTSCDSDADCGEGLRCMAVTFDECPTMPADPPCIDGEDCPEPEPVEEPECETTTENYCLPPYVAPCTVDADCGEGFECIEEELCRCSGYDPGAPGDPETPEPDCTCEPSGELHCVPVEVECESDDVCPDGWTCEIGDVAVPCTYDPETGEEHCDEPEPEDELGLCYPPFWELDWDGGGDEEPSTLEMATGSENPRAQHLDDRFADDEAAGCSMTPGSGGNTSTLALIIPALIALARRRRS
jgi:hypothetical protein